MLYLREVVCLWFLPPNPSPALTTREHLRPQRRAGSTDQLTASSAQMVKVMKSHKNLGNGHRLEEP